MAANSSRSPSAGSGVSPAVNVGPASTPNRHGALGYKLQHFVENELLCRLEFMGRSALIESTASRSQGFSPPHLIVQRGEGQQRLQGIALRWFRGIWRGIVSRGRGIPARPSGHTITRDTTGERSRHIMVRFSGGRRHLETVHL